MTTSSTTTINTESIGERLRRAVSDEDLELVKEICESKEFNVNSALIEWWSDGTCCTVLYYAVYRERMPIVRYLLSVPHIDVNVQISNSGDSPLHSAVGDNNSEVAALLLEHGADRYLQEARYGYSPLAVAASYIERCREVGELLVSGPVDALLVATEEQATLDATKELVQMYETTPDRCRATMTTFIVKMEELLKILLKNSRLETASLELRNTSLHLLNLTTGCFPKIADDSKLSFFLFKGNIFLQFVELASDDLFSQQGLNISTILKSTYVVVQAKIGCDESRQKLLKDLLTPDLFVQFSAQIQKYAEQEKDKDLQCNARRIYTEYIAEKKTVINIKTTSPDKEETSKEETSKKDTTKKEGIHWCKARGYFTLLSCIFGLYFYTNDIITDFAVGLEDYYMFSTRLGTFELFLVVFTLVHENLNSAVMLYETEMELLKIKLGKPVLVSQDWIDASQLNYSDDPIAAFLLMFFWPFKVNGRCCGTMKAVLFNILSLAMLRPIVDRLVVLLHEPSSLRAYYRQRAQQNSLKQFYLILEQIPELLVQFYTFQIVLNKLSSPVEELHPECKQDFFSEYKDKFNNTEPNFFCGNILSGLDSCGVMVRIYSMLIPFCTIPFGIVSLEDGFRILDPTTPKMSSLTKFMLKLVYMLIIPSRLFMFAGVMHALPSHFTVIGYIIGRIGLELVINLTLHKSYLKVIKPRQSWRSLLRWALRRNDYERAELLSKLKSMWALCLFSMRDVFLIALREPDAYTQKPSEVNGKSLRSWRMLVWKSIPYFVEGFAGAILIEFYYPCGRQSHIFKHLGWFCLLLLVISVTLYCLLSDLLHSIPVNTVRQGKFLIKSLMISGCGLVMCVIAALVFLLLKSRTRNERLAVLCVVGVYLLFFGLVIGITKIFGDAKKKRAGTAPKTPKDDITCSVTCGISCSADCISCLCFVCRCCCRGQPSGADVVLQPEQDLEVEASCSDTVGEKATVKDTLL